MNSAVHAHTTAYNSIHTGEFAGTLNRFAFKSSGESRESSVGGFLRLGAAQRGGAQTGSKTSSVEFMDAAPDVQSSSVTVVGAIGDVRAFTITFTNKGAAASQAQTITVSTWKNEDWQNGARRIGAILSQPATLPALQPGSSATLTFTSQSAAGYALKGTVHISGSGNPIQFAL